MEDSIESEKDEYNTPYVQRSTIVRHHPNNIISNMSDGYVPYEEGAVNLQVEDMIKITMKVEKKNAVDNVIHACMLQLSLKSVLKIFYKKGEEYLQR